MWRELIMARFWYCLGIFLEELKKAKNTIVRVGIPPRFKLGASRIHVRSINA
jgi:hypothetical protein